jgi:hypothetical protein
MRLVRSEGISPKDPKTINFKKFYAAVLEIYKIREILSELLNV